MTRQKKNFLCKSKVSVVDDRLGVGHDDMGKALRARHQLGIIDCEDANGNTPLSEAASMSFHVLIAEDFHVFLFSKSVMLVVLVRHLLLELMLRQR